jgi:hypothetical protein
MVKPIGVVAMLIMLTSGPALADDYIKRSDLKQIALSSTYIYYHTTEGNVYSGKIIRHRECPTGRYRKVELSNRISQSFKLHTPEGFSTCRTHELEKIYETSEEMVASVR